MGFRLYLRHPGKVLPQTHLSASGQESEYFSSRPYHFANPHTLPQLNLCLRTVHLEVLLPRSTISTSTLFFCFTMSDGLAEILVFCLCFCCNDPLPLAGFCRPCSCCNPRRHTDANEQELEGHPSGSNSRNRDIELRNTQPPLHRHEEYYSGEHPTGTANTAVAQDTRKSKDGREKPGTGKSTSRGQSSRDTDNAAHATDSGARMHTTTTTAQPRAGPVMNLAPNP
ncbi:hypothetical protein D9757_013481 [Collybiopsis confluens]|uniref:Uncharacterized protein n=1 Tax=Collybiopsis confluens TaxID=2823264 RepID=A0A8H5CPT9_9AGAR|nr:hypothetical protein D9757_013481 [Collybiopsis confluens]